MTEDKTSCERRFGPSTYSHSGEDIVILNLFSNMGIHRPSYLDIGAHSPTTISNTKLLYDSGSRGINVEANPNLIENFYRERPEDENINVGVVPTNWKSQKPLDFYMFDNWSGRNTFSVSAAKDFMQESGITPQTIPVPVKTLAEVLDGRKFPDFFNIDVEGLDYDILREHDFTINYPKIICAESSFEQEHDMIYMMSYKRYKAVIRCGMSNIFVRVD